MEPQYIERTDGGPLMMLAVLREAGHGLPLRGRGGSVAGLTPALARKALEALDGKRLRGEQKRLRQALKAVVELEVLCVGADRLRTLCEEHDQLRREVNSLRERIRQDSKRTPATRPR